ncbi:MAG: nucleotidyltransferase domain-containing protein [Candidatus Cryptobacteroides sp.]
MNSGEIIKRIKALAVKTIPDGGRLILYGSQARNEAKEDSDWDLLILLDKETIDQKDHDEIAYPFRALSWDIGQLISPIIYTMDNWQKMSFTPFYKNVTEEGIVLQ